MTAHMDHRSAVGSERELVVLANICICGHELSRIIIDYRCAYLHSCLKSDKWFCDGARCRGIFFSWMMDDAGQKRPYACRTGHGAASGCRSSGMLVKLSHACRTNRSRRCAGGGWEMFASKVRLTRTVPFGPCRGQDVGYREYTHENG